LLRGLLPRLGRGLILALLRLVLAGLLLPISLGRLLAVLGARPGPAGSIYGPLSQDRHYAAGQNDGSRESDQDQSYPSVDASSEDFDSGSLISDLSEVGYSDEEQQNGADDPKGDDPAPRGSWLERKSTEDDRHEGCDHDDVAVGGAFTESVGRLLERVYRNAHPRKERAEDREQATTDK
jgi:hypothetical protein